jgi:hypothetical protein
MFRRRSAIPKPQNKKNLARCEEMDPSSLQYFLLQNI